MFFKLLINFFLTLNFPGLQFIYFVYFLKSLFIIFVFSYIYTFIIVIGCPFIYHRGCAYFTNVF